MRIFSEGIESSFSFLTAFELKVEMNFLYCNLKNLFQEEDIRRRRASQDTIETGGKTKKRKTRADEQ